MPEQVRGVISMAKGQPVELVDIVVPDPGPGEAVVRVQACGVCHTDLHYRDGGINDQFPFLLGHEAAGIVDRVGDGTTERSGIEPGDFVILNWRAVCGRCRACSRGRPWYCFDTFNATEPMRLAPVYRIKIGLRGAKPPIWRRIEVPGDIGLDRLHAVIQIAFDWDDSHLHVFETPYGRFGTADVELGHHDAASVTLEQVAPAERNKIRYSYDFGDDWQHDIVVEKLLAPDLTGACPRCTGGWRAAPPEDCGGIWGYAGLVETLNDPAAPEHAQRLEWLGLDDATDFDPDRFDAEAVTRALANLP